MTGIFFKVTSLFSAKGRQNRLDHFLTIASTSLGTFLILILATILLPEANDPVSPALQEYTIKFIKIFTLLLYFFLGPAIAIFSAIKRLHDLDHPGYYVLIFFVPIVNLIFGLYLLLKKGTTGPNKYGPQPCK